MDVNIHTEAGEDQVEPLSTHDRNAQKPSQVRWTDLPLGVLAKQGSTIRTTAIHRIPRHVVREQLDHKKVHLFRTFWTCSQVILVPKSASA